MLNTPRPGVKPISPLMLHRIMERRPPHSFPANDRGPITADPALGGPWGVAVMVVVAVFIGLVLAVGKVL